MICRNNKSGVHFNYEFIGENLVNVWNPDKEYSRIITYDKWLNEYTIIDKLYTIKKTINRKRKFKNLKEGDIIYKVRYEGGHIADISKIPIIEISDFDGYTKFVLSANWFLLSKEELNTEAKHGDDSYYCCNKKVIETLIKKDINDLKIHHKKLMEIFEF